MQAKRRLTNPLTIDFLLNGKSKQKRKDEKRPETEYQKYAQTNIQNHPPPTMFSSEIARNEGNAIS